MIYPIVFLVYLSCLYITSVVINFTMFGSPCVYECVVQYGGLSVVSGGLKKGFLEFFVMWGLNLGSLRVYLRCYVMKEVWEFLVVYCFNF